MYGEKEWRQQAILNKSWRQHPTKQQLYGYLPPITKTIQAGRTRYAGHCWRSKDELMRDVFLWTPSHGRAKAGRPARTYIQQLCTDTGCSPWVLLEAMDDREWWHVVPFQQLLEGPMEVLLCEHVNDLRHSLFHLLNCLITTASELRE